MAEMKPLEVEVKSKHTFRPVHYLAGFFWVNFSGVLWLELLGSIPEQMSSVEVALAALAFWLLAMGASMAGYEKASK